MDTIFENEWDEDSTDPRDYLAQFVPLTLHWYSMPTEWFASVNVQPGLGPEMSTQECTCLLTIATILLNIGGTEVVVPKDDPPSIQAANVLMGDTMDATNLVVIQGKSKRSEKNCSELWLNNPHSYRLVRGYVLNGHGIWKSHMWLLDNQDHIVETTAPGTLYRGRVLSDEEVKRFLKSNW